MREDRVPKVTDEVVKVRQKKDMREVGHSEMVFDGVDPLSVKTDMECKFEFGAEQPDVIKEVLNHVYESIHTFDRTSEQAAIHLAEYVWRLKLKVSWLSKKNRERRSTIDGITECESDIGMVRLASTICPSLEDIKLFAEESTIVHPDGMSVEERADLYSHRPEILAELLVGLGEEDWPERFREACLKVLEKCAVERAEAEEALASVDEILEHGHLLSDEERQQINLKVIERPEIEEEVVVIDDDVSRETSDEEG